MEEGEERLAFFDGFDATGGESLGRFEPLEPRSEEGASVEEPASSVVARRERSMGSARSLKAMADRRRVAVSASSCE